MASSSSTPHTKFSHSEPPHSLCESSGVKAIVPLSCAKYRVATRSAHRVRRPLFDADRRFSAPIRHHLALLWRFGKSGKNILSFTKGPRFFVLRGFRFDEGSSVKHSAFPFASGLVVDRPFAHGYSEEVNEPRSSTTEKTKPKRISLLEHKKLGVGAEISARIIRWRTGCVSCGWSCPQGEPAA